MGTKEALESALNEEKARLAKEVKHLENYLFELNRGLERFKKDEKLIHLIDFCSSFNFLQKQMMDFQRRVSFAEGIRNMNRLLNSPDETLE